MKIGILQTGHAPDALRPDTGDYADFFETLLADRDLTFRTWSVVDMDFPVSVSDCEGWLLTGSRHGAYENHPFIAPLEDFIRAAFDADVPLVGICFGHQIIAQALGGKVEKFVGGWAAGRQEYDWGGETVALNAWHQDQVTVKPPGATVCATNDFCANAALVYGKTAFTVQAHPEFTSPFMERLADVRGPGLVPAPILADVHAKATQPIDDSLIADRIARFFKERKITP